MKKTLKFITLSVIMVLLAVTMTGCTSTEENNNTDATNITNVANKSEKVEIQVYEDSYVKVVYTGIDYEEEGLAFEITNKSNKNFSFTFESILVDGKTEQPAYSVSVLSNSKSDYICDVSSTEKIKTITGEMQIYDEDGYEIEKFSVKDVVIK